jgi:hypothetical protein
MGHLNFSPHARGSKRQQEPTTDGEEYESVELKISLKI